MCVLAAPADEMIRIDQIWLAVGPPLDMRAGRETALARVISIFGAAYHHHVYIFANRRRSRMKVLVHDGIGVWLAARRLNQGRFAWPRAGAVHVTLADEQLQALVTGLPWHQLGPNGENRRFEERQSGGALIENAQRTWHTVSHEVAVARSRYSGMFLPCAPHCVSTCSVLNTVMCRTRPRANADVRCCGSAKTSPRSWTTRPRGHPRSPGRAC